MVDNDRIKQSIIIPRLLTLGILLLAVVVRFYKLGAASLWHDEAFTWWFTRMNWFEMLDTVRLDGVNPPVFYLFVKIVVWIFGNDEFGLRLISALAGSIAIVIAMQIGDIAGGRTGKYIAGIVLTLHPMAIWFSRDARPYALGLLLSLLSFFIYLTLRKNNTPVLWWISSITIVLGLLTHYFFFIFWGALIFLAITEFRTKRLFFRHWTLHSLIAFIPLAAWIVWYFSQPVPSLGIGWIESPGIVDPLFTIWNLFSGFGGEFHIATLLFGLIVMALVIVGVWSSKDDQVARWSFWVGVLAPVLGVWIVSQRRPVYMDRYFIVLLPFIVYLTAVSGKRIKNWNTVRFSDNVIKGLATISVISFVIFTVLLGWLINKNLIFQNEDWRGLVSVFQQYRESNEPVWFSEPEASIPFQYYFRHEISAIEGHTVPICLTPCWLIARQPYTATHAFAQGISQADRPWRIDVPSDCSHSTSVWQYPGLELMRIQCD